jgi:hypothetical protein
MIGKDQEKESVGNQNHRSAAECRNKTQRANRMKSPDAAHRFHNKRTDHGTHNSYENGPQRTTGFTARKNKSGKQTD